MRLSSLTFPAIALMMAISPASAEEKHHPPAAESGKGAETQGAAPARPGMGMMRPGMMEEMMGMMAAGGPAARLLAPTRIEGRIAYLRAELAVTSSQEAAFAALAAALRSSDGGAHAVAPAAGKMPMGAMGPAPQPTIGLADKLAHDEHVAAARLGALKSVRSAYEVLDKQLSAEQRKTAEILLPLLFPVLG